MLSGWLSGLGTVPNLLSRLKTWTRFLCFLFSSDFIFGCTVYVFSKINHLFIAVRCPKLSAPSYGSVTVSGLEVGSTATYECDDGFLLIGSSSRYCQQYGDWSGEAPICNRELIHLKSNLPL